MFDDEFFGPLTGALSGTVTADPLADTEPTLDIWEDKQWLMNGRKHSDPLGRIIRAGGFVSREPDPTDPSNSLPLGTFDLTSWERSVENANIPASFLDHVGDTEFLMEPHAAAAAWAMMQAARADGVTLSIGNTYRDYAAQAAAYQDYVNGNRKSPAAKPGTSNHGWGLAVDFQITEENHAWLVANAARFGFSNPFGNSYNAVENWHWEYGQQGQAPDYTSDTVSATNRPRDPKDPIRPDLSQVPLALAPGDGSDLPMIAGYGGVMANLLMPDKPQGTRRSFGGPRGSIEKQLYQGFMDAGRPDLAKLVGTPDFTAWVRAESGWNPSAVSPPNNHGLANVGLFQFWLGHGWAQGADGWSPYQQALAVVRYFDLSPEDIHRYAEQIRNGTYRGWG